ncbi:hypothetical protein [Actinophytocola sp.]|uniref:hypothetical protein n=1 Tax=Actinophytocola sp. TaxID=1872138 RepID=UPI002ED02BBB
MTAAFDKASYGTGEDMTIGLALKNTSADDMRVSVSFDRRASNPNSVYVTATTTFKEYAEFTIAAGATVTNVLTGTVINPNATAGTLIISLAGPGGPTESTFTVPVTKKLATAAGTVFYDRNGNGEQDRGEGVRATLSWESKVDLQYEPTTTAGAGGAFSVELVPGKYIVRGTSGDFLVTPQEVTVPASGVDNLVFEARPTLTDLDVEMVFTKDTYKPTEAPTVRVTLTNNGNTPVSEVIADCFHSSDWPGLTGTGAGWGDLAGGGVAVAAKSTKVLTVTESMPAQAENFGYVSVDCVFAYAELTGDLDNPRAGDKATVPGKSAVVKGAVSVGPDLSGAGFRVVLTGADGKCPIIAEATTDANGRFTLGEVPVGEYIAYVLPPTPRWIFKGNNDKPVTVIAGRENFIGYVAFPAEADNDFLKQPPTCGGGGGGPGATPPGPQGSTKPGLAYTGASIIVPGVAGLLALMAGIGAVLVTRRRKAS